MTYAEAVSYLLSVGQELRGVKFDLASVSRLLEELGRPDRAWPSIHIAGTNGKGSVAALLDSVLRAAGYRTGLYTSPHLVRVNERIRVGGREISDADFAARFARVQQAVEGLLASHELPHHPSFFECLTAIAFQHFREAGCQIAVLETGMGGRLDATNVVTPLVSVITLIDFDHEAYLGSSIEQIASEKAGIIKPGVAVVTGAQRPEAAAVIERTARERGARLVETGESSLNGSLRVGLPGRHQRANAALALAAIDELRRQGLNLPMDAVARGLAGVRWPGRLEMIEGEGHAAVLLDGAHNPAGARALEAYLAEELAGRRLVLLFGAMRDKAVEEIAEILFSRFAAVVLTRPNQKRAASPAALAEAAGHLNRCVREIEDVAAAFRAASALAGPDGVVVVSGSLYLVGEVRPLLEGGR